MKKAVVIPYVIALVLGVAVVGLLGYWFVSQGGKTIGVGGTTECDALCVSWRNSGFNIKPSGINKCTEYEGVAGQSACMNKLGCGYVSLSDQCPSGWTYYGTTFDSTTKKVCCPG